MKAGNSSFKQNKMITTAWDGDWESFKQKLEATADLNGLNEAVSVGQLLAEGKINWPWFPSKVERPDEVTSKVEMSNKVASKVTSNNKFMSRATVQSHRLASILILSLLGSIEIQKSIVGDRLRYEKNGTRAWVDLVLHFEMNSKDLRVESLTKKWDEAMLQTGEYPDKLWTKLALINQNLAKLGEEFKESHFMRRFIAGIKAQPGHPYKQVLTMYKGSVITGSPLSINQMRELLSETFEDEKVADGQEASMKGFIAFQACEVCKKKGHTKDDCWVANPEIKPKIPSRYQRKGANNKGTGPTCWGCGKPGHVKRECRALSNNSFQRIAAAIASSPIINDKPIYVDSACPCHLMADVKYLEPKTITRTAETITAVGGQKINLTQKGTAKLPTADDMLILTNTYYAQGVHFGLVSVLQLVQRGVSVHLTKEQAYLEKDGTKINLRQVGDLWALPIKQNSDIAALTITTMDHHIDGAEFYSLAHVALYFIVTCCRETHIIKP